MKQKLLTYLACPACGGEIRLLSVARREDDGEILEGDLDCASCARHFPIVRGVPRFAELDEIEEEKAQTAANFGWQWQHFTQEDEHYDGAVPRLDCSRSSGVFSRQGCARRRLRQRPSHAARRALGSTRDYQY